MAAMIALGISVNTRVIGIAIIRSDMLLDFSVRLFKESWSDMKAERIIASLTPYLIDHGITNVALTIPHAHYQYKETEALITRIKEYLRKQKISVATYHAKAFNALCPQAKAKKKALMSCMVDLYPELALPYRKELHNRRRYYHKLFEAVAAGTLLSRALTQM